MLVAKSLSGWSHAPGKRHKRPHFSTGHPAAGQRPARELWVPPGLFSGIAGHAEIPPAAEPPFGMTCRLWGAAVGDDLPSMGGLMAALLDTPSLFSGIAGHAEIPPAAGPPEG